jgi:hypothetical protein
MKLKLIIFLSVIYSYGFAQGEFSVSRIPDSLKKDANAVIRFDETIFTLESLSKCKTQKHWAVTIFNEVGEKNYSTFSAHYDKFSKVKAIEGEIFDQYGKSLKKLKKSDIQDIGYGAFQNDITDNRIKIAEFDKKYYPFPYTVEFSYDEESSNMMFMPSWDPIDYEKIGIQQSHFIFKTANGLTFRKKEINLKSPSIKSNNGDYLIETWELKNMVPYDMEEFSTSEDYPHVKFAPKYFILDGYEGQMNTWEQFSSFSYNLNKDRDQVPEATIVKLKEFIGDEKDKEKIIKKVYEFVQANTRYMSIQLGVGGWQTMLAKDIADRGYGDCKALSNYTVALLKKMGIMSHVALIKAGEEHNFANDNYEFVRSNFNHVIACVPMQKDTIWLECTSQTNPFGYQGDFTGNRKALIVKETGGKLVNTTKYKSQDNLQNRTANINIDDVGNAKVVVKTIYTGIQQESKSSYFLNLNQKEYKDKLIQKINIQNFEIEKIESKIVKNKIPAFEETINLYVNKLTNTSGNRLFLKTNLMTGFLTLPVKTDIRKNLLYLNPNVYTFCDNDTIKYTLPKGYTVEFLPKSITEKQEFGEYKTSTKFENDQVIFTRSIVLNGGTYPKEAYENWINFIKIVNKNDAQKLVLIKKQIEVTKN